MICKLVKNSNQIAKISQGRAGQCNTVPPQGCFSTHSASHFKTCFHFPGSNSVLNYYNLSYAVIQIKEFD